MIKMKKTLKFEEINSITKYEYTGIIFENDNIANFDFGSYYTANLTFINCTFDIVDLSRTNNIYCTFINCAFTNCYFGKCEIKSSFFDHSNFENCNFWGADIYDSILCNCLFLNCDFQSFTIMDCKLSLITFQNIENHKVENFSRNEEYNVTWIEDKIDI